MKLSLDPGVVVLVLGSVALYARAVAVLGARGYRVPLGQRAAWYGGLALTAIGLLSPVDGYSDDLLSAHMVQHLLIADLAAPLLLVGLRSPVHVFLLPRSVLVPLARARPLRAAFRFLRRPLVALPVFVLVLYGWHLSFAFEAALRSPAVHALQHISFVGASLLVWWPAIEPKRRRLPGELWKIGHLAGARLASMFLGMAFLFMQTPAYAPIYGEAAREHGLTPLGDQQLAGGMMMVLDILIIMFALTLFFWRAARDHDQSDQHRAAGVSPPPVAT